MKNKARQMMNNQCRDIEEKSVTLYKTTVKKQKSLDGTDPVKKKPSGNYWQGGFILFIVFFMIQYLLFLSQLN